MTHRDLCYAYLGRFPESRYEIIRDFEFSVRAGLAEPDKEIASPQCYLAMSHLKQYLACETYQEAQQLSRNIFDSIHLDLN